eukprot:854459-Pelagomonas_calceolata.AAC.3
MEKHAGVAEGKEGMAACCAEGRGARSAMQQCWQMRVLAGPGDPCCMFVTGRHLEIQSSGAGLDHF